MLFRPQLSHHAPIELVLKQRLIDLNTKITDLELYQLVTKIIWRLSGAYLWLDMIQFVDSDRFHVEEHQQLDHTFNEEKKSKYSFVP